MEIKKYSCTFTCYVDLPQSQAIQPWTLTHINQEPDSGEEGIQG